MLHKTLISFIFCMTMMLSINSKAATFILASPFTTDPAIGCSILLEGEIQKGDASKLEALIKTEKSKQNIGRIIDLDQQIVLCLSSQGGAYLEGFELADVVKKQFITTKIKPNDTCVSACAIAFMGGTLDQGAFAFTSRYIHPTSKLGFHAPLLQVSEGNYTKKSVENAYSIAIKSIGLLTKKADELQFSKHLINKITNTTGESFFYIKQIKDLAFMNVLLYGYKTPKKNNRNRMALCENLWNINFDIYDQPKEFADAKLKAPKSKLGKKGKVLTFYPWEGEAYCDTLFDQKYGGGNLDQVTISEFANFSDKVADQTFAAWARLPFSSLISNLKNGKTRDFK